MISSVELKMVFKRLEKQCVYIYIYISAIHPISPLLICGSRRDQEEGGGAGPSREPRRDQELGLESWTSFASVVTQQQCYENCPCDSALHSSWNSSCIVHYLLRNGEGTLPSHFCCSGDGPRPPRSSGSVRAVEPSLFRPLPPLSPSLISHLASVDVKQNVHLASRKFPKRCHWNSPMFVWLTMALSRPFEKARRALPLSTPLMIKSDHSYHQVLITGTTVMVMPCYRVTTAMVKR